MRRLAGNFESLHLRESVVNKVGILIIDIDTWYVSPWTVKIVTAQAYPAVSVGSYGGYGASNMTTDVIRWWIAKMCGSIHNSRSKMGDSEITRLKVSRT